MQKNYYKNIIESVVETLSKKVSLITKVSTCSNATVDIFNNKENLTVTLDKFRGYICLSSISIKHSIASLLLENNKNCCKVDCENKLVKETYQSSNKTRPTHSNRQ